MSDSITDSLNIKKIQQLLEAVGVESDEDTMNNIDAIEYNWNQPHCFNRKQLIRLDNFTEKVTVAMAEKFTDFYHSDFNITITSNTQHFAQSLFNPNEKKDDYYVGFGDREGHPVGLIGIPTTTAAIWATQLLGGSLSEANTEKELSQLEESLLLDVCSALVKAISNSHSEYNLRPTGNIIKGALPFALQDGDIFCRISFNVKRVDSEISSEAYLLMLCSQLESIVQQNNEAAIEPTADEISKVISNYVKQMPVTITAQFDSVTLPFKEIMNLSIGNILLLDKKAGDPVELILDGKTFSRGQPAKSTGKYAAVITELCDLK